MRPTFLPLLASIILAACSPGIPPEAVIDFEREVEAILAAHGQPVDLNRYARFYTGQEVGEGPQLPGPEQVNGVFVPGSLAGRTGAFLDQPADYPAFEDNSQCPLVFGATYDIREAHVVSIDVCGTVLMPETGTQ